MIYDRVISRLAIKNFKISSVRQVFWAWRDILVLKRIWCSPRGHRFNSWHLCGSANPSLTTAAGLSISLGWILRTLHACGIYVYMYMCIFIHIYAVRALIHINKKYFKKENIFDVLNTLSLSKLIFSQNETQCIFYKKYMMCLIHHITAIFSRYITLKMWAIFSSYHQDKNSKSKLPCPTWLLEWIKLRHQGNEEMTHRDIGKKNLCQGGLNSIWETSVPRMLRL